MLQFPTYNSIVHEFSNTHLITVHYFCTKDCKRIVLQCCQTLISWTLVQSKMQSLAFKMKVNYRE